MNENQNDDNNLLRKHSSKERLIHSDSDITDDTKDESASVFQTYSRSDDLGDSNSLFHYKKETILSDSIHGEPEDPDILDNVSESAASSGNVLTSDENASDTSFPIFLSFKANDSIENVSDGLREKNIIRGGNPANQESEKYVPSILSQESEAVIPVTGNMQDEFDSFDLDHSVMNTPIFKPFVASSVKDEGISEESVIKDEIPETDNTVGEDFEEEGLLSDAPAVPADIHEDPDIPQDEPASSSMETTIDAVIPKKSDLLSNGLPVEESVTNNSDEPDVPAFSEEIASPDANVVSDSKTVEPVLLVEQPLGWQFSTEEDLTYRTPSNKSNAQKDDAVKPIDETLPVPDADQIQERPAHRLTHAPYAPRSVEAIKERESTGNDASALASVLTVRSDSRYTAAQQKGITPPMPPREIKVKKTKSASHKPLLFILLIIALFVLGLSAWSYIDISGLFSGGTKASSESTPITSVTATTKQDTTSATTKETTAAATATPSPTPTPTPEPTATPTPTPTTTPSPTPVTVSAKIPSAFSTKITDGISTADIASFNIQFTNSGGNDVSLFDGVEYITVTYRTSITITEVTSDDFIFTAKPNAVNTFIGVPVSTDTIANKDTKTVGISAKTDGADIGDFTIKYYIKCYS